LSRERERRTLLVSERQKRRTAMIRVIEHLIAAIEGLLYPDRRSCHGDR
jgi:hypothetical protein